MSLRKLFIAASSASAAVPGVAVIIKGIGSPPDQQTLFGGLIEAIGALSLLILLVNRDKIRGVEAEKITRWSVALGLTSILLFFAYIAMFGTCVKSDSSGTTFIPIWTSGELKQMIQKTGSRDAAISVYGVDAIHDAIRKMPSVALPLTTVFLLLVLLTALNSLTLAFGLIGFHEGAGL